MGYWKYTKRSRDRYVEVGIAAARTRNRAIGKRSTCNWNGTDGQRNNKNADTSKRNGELNQRKSKVIWPAWGKALPERAGARAAALAKSAILVTVMLQRQNFLSQPHSHPLNLKYCSCCLIHVWPKPANVDTGLNDCGVQYLRCNPSHRPPLIYTGKPCIR